MHIELFYAKSTQKVEYPLQISTRLGLQVVPQVVPQDLLVQTKVWLQKLFGFYFTALWKLSFSCIFAVPDLKKQTITSFLPHICRQFLQLQKNGCFKIFFQKNFFVGRSTLSQVNHDVDSLFTCLTICSAKLH